MRAAAGVGSGCGGVEEGQHELIASNQASAGWRQPAAHWKGVECHRSHPDRLND